MTMALVVLAMVAQAPNNKPAPPLPALALADQYDRPFAPASYHGNVLILLYGDRASTEPNKILGEYLHVTFHPTAKGLPPAQAHQQPVRPLADAAPGVPSPDVFTVPVACCGKVPQLIQGLIRGQIKAGAPDVPVMVDFNDVMKTAFGLTEKVPNLVIVDRSGNVRYTANGPFTPDQLSQITAAVENLRREPVRK